MKDLELLREMIDRLPGTGLAKLYQRSLLLTQDYSRPEIDALCALAETFEALDRAGVAVPLFPNEMHWALFFDKSTRTKSSWAGASARLGARPVVVDGGTTQVSHGETARETGAMLGMNAHALGIRHDMILGAGNRFMRDARHGLSEYLNALGDERVVPVVNLQCDVDHPTQTLADLCWLNEKFPQGLVGKKIAVSWAYSPSYAKPLSVPQGLITLLTRFGARVQLAHPEGYDLTQETVDLAHRFAASSGGEFSVTHNMDEAFAGADVVYPKSWGAYDLMLERVDAYERDNDAQMADVEARALERNAKHKDWICDGRRMGLTKDGCALYMHCLPADIDAEVSQGVLESARFDLSREAHKKLYVMMALLAAPKEQDLAGRLRQCLLGR